MWRIPQMDTLIPMTSAAIMRRTIFRRGGGGLNDECSEVNSGNLPFIQESLPVLRSGAMLQHSARPGVGELSVGDDRRSVHDDPVDAYGILVRLRERAFVGDRRRIEDRDVGEAA